MDDMGSELTYLLGQTHALGPPSCMSLFSSFLKQLSSSEQISFSRRYLRLAIEDPGFLYRHFPTWYIHPSFETQIHFVRVGAGHPSIYQAKVNVLLRFKSRV